MTKFLNNVDVKGYVSQTDVTSSLLKADPTGKLVAAIAGTDYQTPTALASADRMVTVGRNATGATLYKGTIVYISGSTGNRPNFVKALASGEPTSAGTFGVVYADIPNNSDGNVVTIGVIDTLDTRSNATNPFTSDTLADGDTIYLSPTTAGYITNVKPSAPNHLVYLGKVVRTSPTNGTIVYRVQNGYELDELHDVALSSLINNQGLFYEISAGVGLWKNKTIAAVLGYTPANDSSVVHIEGAETINGQKTFTSTVYTTSTLSINNGTLVGNNIVSMRANPTGGQFRIEKSDGSLSAYPFYVGVDGTALAYYYNASGALKVLLHTNGTSYFGNSLSIGYATYAATSYSLDVNGSAQITSTLQVGGNLYGVGATFLGNLTTNGTFNFAATGNVSFTSNDANNYARFTGNAASAQIGLFRASDGGMYIGGAAAGFRVFDSSFNTRLLLTPGGQLQLNTYTSATSYTGTAAGYLAFDSSGNIITVASVGGGTDNTKLPLAGGTMTGALVVAAGDRGFEVNASGGISLYSNEINAGALGGTGTIYLGWRRTTQVNVGVPMVLSSTISASGNISSVVAASAWALMGTTSGYSNNSGIWFTSNVGELILRKADGNIGVRIAADGSNAYINGSQILLALNYNSYSPTLTGGGANGTWGINVTGDAGSVGGVTTSKIVYGENSTATTSITNATLDGALKSGFYTVGSGGIPNATGVNFVLHTAYYGIGNLAGFDLACNDSTTSQFYLRPATGAGKGAWQTIVTNSGTWSISITGNAATLGGYGPNQTGGLNTIVQRDSNGYIQNSYFYTSGGGAERNNSGLSYVAGFNSGDYYIRSYNGAAVASLVQSNASGSWGISVTGTSYGMATQWLNTGSMNISSGYSQVLRNENGLGGAVTYSPLLHMAASDTMWQLQGTYGSSGNGTLYFRQGYSGNWGNWLTMISSANIGSQSVAYASTAGNSSTTSQRSFDYLYTSSYLESAGAVYGTIFYDNNDRGYYLDPNATGTALRLGGNIFANGSFGTNGYGSGALVGRVFAPKGATFSLSAYANITGAIKIRLPQRGNDTMWSMRVRIYNYNTYDTSEYLLGNYSYSQGAWNYSATYLGGTSSVARTVRFGNEGGYDCVWIGETSTGWTHPVVSVMDFMGGYANGSCENWDDNWDINIVSAFGTVAVAVAPNINFNEVYSYSYRGNGNVAGTGSASYHPSGVYSTGTNWLYGTMYLNNNTIYDAGNIYNSGWFRNNNSLQGLYNQANNQHFYASGTLWNITSNNGGDGGLIMRTDHQSTIKGYLYYNSSGSGLLNNSGEWGVRLNYGGGNAGGQLYGTWSLQTATSGANLFLGSQDYARVYNDSDRHGLVINAPYYPHIDVNATANAGNGTHGAVISMTGVLSGGGFRRWGMGIANTDPSHFSIGWYDNQSNPHFGVGHSWAGYGGRFIIDTSGNIWCTGDITAYGAQSDIRLKTIKEKVPNALEGVLKLNGYRFDWKERDVKITTFVEDIGVVAQEVKEVFPELARTGEDGWMSVRYQGLTAVLIEAVKEQQAQILSQGAQITELMEIIKTMKGL